MQDRSQQSRRSTRNRRRRNYWAIIALVIAGIAAIAAGIWGTLAQSGEPETSPVAQSTPKQSAEPSAAAHAVELPDVLGVSVEQARVVMQTAGVVVVVEESRDEAVSKTADLTVLKQDPPAGTVVAPGSTVTLTVPRLELGGGSTSKPAGKQWVVCIDPGHQSRSDSSPEKIGPGATETKPAVTGGATGVATKIPEYEIVLQISMNLKKRLEAKGIKVVMTRTTNDVTISNAERAAVANNAHADLFLRVHANGSPNSATTGLSTLYPAPNKWTRPFAAQSKTAAGIVQKSVIASTGAVNEGIKERADLSGFNWSKVPCILVECGYLSNPVEDKLLASPHYQDKLAQGMADGVVSYLESEAKR